MVVANILSSEGTTQGDPLALAIYSVSVTPLITLLQDPSVAQVRFADDATAGGTLQGLLTWWTGLKHHGSMYGYFSNAANNCKARFLSSSRQLITGTGQWWGK